MEVGHGHDAHVVKVREHVVRCVVDFDQRVVDEIGEGVGHHEHVEQVVWLIIPVATIVEDKGIYN